MIKLAPSLLAANFADLTRDITAVEKAGAHYLHLDVMDGRFVPNISFGIPVIRGIRPVSPIFFDVHLMIEEPERYLEAFAEAGADLINVHIEACAGGASTVKKIKALGKKAAVALRPDTGLESVYHIAGLLDMALIMSVEPGFGGQRLIKKTLVKAKELADFAAREGLTLEIQMDGGIGLDNLSWVLESGVNVVVAGSSVFNGEPEAQVKRFYEAFSLCEKNRNGVL